MQLQVARVVFANAVGLPLLNMSKLSVAVVGALGMDAWKVCLHPCRISVSKDTLIRSARATREILWFHPCKNVTNHLRHSVRQLWEHRLDRGWLELAPATTQLTRGLHRHPPRLGHWAVWGGCAICLYSQPRASHQPHLEIWEASLAGQRPLWPSRSGSGLAFVSWYRTPLGLRHAVEHCTEQTPDALADTCPP